VVKGLHVGVIDRTAAGVTLDGTPVEPSTDGVESAGTAASEQLLDLLDVDSLRTVAVATGVGRAGAGALDPARGRRLSLRSLGPRGVAALARVSGDRPADVSANRVAASPLSRAAAVTGIFRDAVAENKRPLVRSTIGLDLDLAQHLVAAHLATEVDDLTTVTPQRAARALRTVTAPRPFLRWDPVPVPAVVPLRAFTEGESLRVLVVRSGVTQDPLTLAVTTTAPDEYAADVQATAPLYAAQAQRHVAPPKTSQVQAEVHGVFDEGIDAGTTDARRRMLAWALRENGTFFDQSVPHLTDPSGTPSPRAGTRAIRPSR
jgi:hypothetical protein